MKYCRRCGTALDDNAKFCSRCGAKCDSNDNYRRKETGAGNYKIKYKKGKKKKIAVCIVIAVLIVIVAGVIDSGGIRQFFSDLKKGSEEAEKKAKENDSKENHKESENNVLTEDGTAYRMTVEEYCERFNQIAGESWCSSSVEVMRRDVEKETRQVMEEAARTDADIAERLMQTMTPEMIPDVTLLKNDATEELNGSENYVTYTYINQYSFIPAHIGIQILARRDTDEIVGIAAEFPMDYRNVGEKFGKLICDSYGEEFQGGEFQELYNKMKEAGGYGHSYKDGTVFELMYKEGSDTTALFKMSACTEEHYEEAWLNNPDLPSKENPIKDVSDENEEQDIEDVEQDALYDAEDNSDQSRNIQPQENVETDGESNISKSDLIRNFSEYSGRWGDFGAHVDPYQGMVEAAIESSISMSDYFGGDVNEVYLEAYGFQWDGRDMSNAGCILTFEGQDPDTGQYRTLVGTVSFDESDNLEFHQVSYN